MDYLLRLRDKVDEYKLKGKSSFSKEEYRISKIEYLKLLDEWDKEYIDDHLRFLANFKIDFINNLVERGLRKIKNCSRI